MTATGSFQDAKVPARTGDYVSVVVPTRNRADTLRQCLNSLLDQDYPRKSFEIVVVDNGSTDDTPRVVMEEAEGITYPPMRLIRCLLYTSDAADDLLCVDLGG